MAKKQARQQSLSKPEKRAFNANFDNKKSTACAGVLAHRYISKLSYLKI